MREPLKYYGVKLKASKKLMESQSGGAFYAIASYFISQLNAVVYGCGMNESNEAVYVSVTTIEGLSLLHGSKYVQAKLGNAYELVKNDLDSGRIVLFSGTPCYVSGVINCFAGNKNFKNLYTVDLICHGVPSPLVFNRYKEYIEDKHKKI